MTWYQTIRGNYIFLRLPIENRFCKHGQSYNCGFGTCTLDGSRRNLAECGAKCAKFTPTFGQRLRLAFKILAWRGSNR